MLLPLCREVIDRREEEEKVWEAGRRASAAATIRGPHLAIFTAIAFRASCGYLLLY